MNQGNIANILLNEGFCAALDESNVLSEIILSDLLEEEKNKNEDGDIWENLGSVLQEHLDISQEQSKNLVLRIKSDTIENDDEEEHPQSSAEQAMHPDEEYDKDEEDEAGAMLFDGECELCDREIKLTKHHLIPKSTWPRIQTKLQHAAEAKEKGNLDKALVLLGPGLERILDQLTSEKSSIRRILRETCNVCRPCHSTVHRAHENMDLAISYSSVDQLLEDQKIVNFCKWASKQRPGKYSVK